MDEQLDASEIGSVRPNRSEILDGKYPIRVAVGGYSIKLSVTNSEECLSRESARYASEIYNSFTKRAPSARVDECLAYALYTVAVELKQVQAELESLKQEMEEINDRITQTLFV